MGPKKKKEAAAPAAEPDVPMAECLQEGYEAGWDYKESTDRVKKYKQEQRTNKEVYTLECERLGKKVNSQLAADLEGSLPGQYDMKELNLNGNIIGNVAVLLDLLRMNPDIDKIFLKDNGIQNNAVPLLCQALAQHPGVTTIDLTGNKHVGYVAGKALLNLAQHNHHICAIRIGKTGIPPNTKEKVETQALMNFNRERVSRTDYLSVRADFRKADKDGNGVVQLSELIAHERRKLELSLLQKAKKTGDAAKDKAAEKERAAKMKEGEAKIKQTAEKMFAKLDRDGDQKLSQAEFMRFYFSGIPEKTLQLFIEKYDAEERRGSRAVAVPRLTEDQIIDMFEKYDVNKDGGLTKAELREGLADQSEEIDTIFKEYDLDGGDTLGLGEFMMFMAKRGAL